ncbi:zinc-dependent metalloprotease [Canibacter sp. lx-45]|uniref:zinc-dependent metalloprotease n=1 Tax=Canibacter zhuwentaonis TaxID=2837491 RepID=UPI001BDDB8E7|nr:zinc-dependent metalloprotease [Canibacter zhuwentaonis]MBT1034984.1 zinc-dependent metalloprotease [Canibacter zhuwentaonis]
MSDSEDNENEFTPEEFFAQLQKALEQGGVNLSDINKLAGKIDSEQLREMLAMMNESFTVFGGATANAAPADAATARNTAYKVAGINDNQLYDTPEVQKTTGQIRDGITMLNSWLDETVAFSATHKPPQVTSRKEWIDATLEGWMEYAEPVNNASAKTAGKLVSEQLGDDVKMSAQNIASFFKNASKTVFRTQFGTAVGSVAKDALSGGDIRVPLSKDEAFSGGCFIAENMHQFAANYEDSQLEVLYYLIVRELAYARLFTQAKWLRQQIIGYIKESADAFYADTSYFEELAEKLADQADGHESILNADLLKPPVTEAQQRVHKKIEHLLALVEGWVSAVTANATKHLTNASAIKELMQRRNAANSGPAEQAFKILIGLELQPAQLTKSIEVWHKLTSEIGVKKRDALWQHPDLLPTRDEIAAFDLLLNRINDTPSDNPATQSAQQLDEDLQKLLNGGYDGAATEPQPGFDPPPEK